MKFKRIILCIIFSFCLVGCSPIIGGHQHIFSEQWFSDETNHFRKCSCGEESFIEPHFDLDNDERCDTCGYLINITPTPIHEHTFSEDWSFNNVEHWHAATCEHSDLLKDLSNHTYESNGICSVCRYTYKYKDNFTFDDKTIYFKDNKFSMDSTEAEALLDDLNDNPEKVVLFFDCIYSYVIRNFFNITCIADFNGALMPLGAPQMADIYYCVLRKIDYDKHNAEVIASTNGTSFKDELNAIFVKNNVNNLDELFEKYLLEEEKIRFNENVIKYFVDDLKNGDPNIKDVTGKQILNGYIEDMVPYHVSHILVILDDDSNTNFTNGTISANDVDQLYSVVNYLAKGELSFAKLADACSDDFCECGDIGIMNYSTEFYNEFKLSVYAYENFFNYENKKDKVIESNICVPGNNASEVTGIAKNFLDASEEAFGSKIPEISFEVFNNLYNVRNIESNSDGTSVTKDAANSYPRNIIYNKYLNRHSFAFITVPDFDEHILTEKEKETKYTGFINDPNLKKNILSIKTPSGWSPILCVRGGNDGFAGINFISINRSVFDINSTVSPSDYFTTYYPDSKYYPVDNNGCKLETYVTTPDISPQYSRNKADNLLYEIFTYNTDRLNKYLFTKYFEAENLSFKNTNIDAMLKLWISKTLSAADIKKQEQWEERWTNYIEMLQMQNLDRSKLIV